MSYDANNIFAKILRGELTAVKVYEDEATLAFMDIFPQSKGHVLVVPKTPARDMLDCPPDVAANLMRVTQRLAQAVDRALKPDGITLIQFNRAAAGQSVFHVHFHIVPRYEGVPLKGHGHAPQADAAALEALAAKIKAAL
jgi:histidine triad (HIT) family protein